MLISALVAAAVLGQFTPQETTQVGSWCGVCSEKNKEMCLLLESSPAICELRRNEYTGQADCWMDWTQCDHWRPDPPLEPIPELYSFPWGTGGYGSSFYWPNTYMNPWSSPYDSYHGGGYGGGFSSGMTVGHSDLWGSNYSYSGGDSCADCILQYNFYSPEY